MRKEPCYSEYQQVWAEVYDRNNYDRSLAAHLLKRSHSWLENCFTDADFFPKVLEVGAGSCVHVKYVRHLFDEYWATDLNMQLMKNGLVSLDKAVCEKLYLQEEDAANLSFADNSFDRLIATHVLEHISDPHRVLREWVRVLKPGGILSLLLPTDPGIVWRFGRTFGPRRRFLKTGLPYDYWMAREHINPIHNLIALIRYYFDDVQEIWRPLYLPTIDLNLFYICHIKIMR